MFTVLALGTASQTSHANMKIISDMLAAVFVPALEAIVCAEAKTVYAGTYTGGINSSSTLAVVVDDRPGLGITCWAESGTDVFLPHYNTSEGDTSAARTEPGQREVYPSGLKSNDGTKVGWRAVYKFSQNYGSGCVLGELREPSDR